MASWVLVNIGFANGLLPDDTVSIPKYLFLKMGSLNQTFTNSSLFGKILKSKITFGLAGDPRAFVWLQILNGGTKQALGWPLLLYEYITGNIRLW